MIIDYELVKHNKPNERKAWYLSEEICAMTNEPYSKALMNAIQSGMYEVREGILYQWCSDCADYHTLDKFVKNEKRRFGVTKICAEAYARRRRIQNYCVASFATDVGCRYGSKMLSRFNKSEVIPLEKSKTSNIKKEKGGDD